MRARGGGGGGGILRLYQALTGLASRRIMISKEIDGLQAFMAGAVQ